MRGPAHPLTSALARLAEPLPQEPSPTPPCRRAALPSVGVSTAATLKRFPRTSVVRRVFDGNGSRTLRPVDSAVGHVIDFGMCPPRARRENRTPQPPHILRRSSCVGGSLLVPATYKHSNTTQKNNYLRAREYRGRG